MKYLLAILLVSYISISAGQEFKRGINWCIGYSPPLQLDFSNNMLSIDTFEKLGPSLTFGVSNVSDTNGILQFFCNGFHVYDDKGWPLEWGTADFDTINTPLGSKLRAYYNGDGFFNQMSIILPKKGNTYYVFTTGMSDQAYDDWKLTVTDFRFDVLSWHIVDMDANAGAGKVVSKNNILMQDARLSHNRMTAIRHANGRDWWLIKPHQWRQTFYTFLVTPDTIQGPNEQLITFDMSGLDAFTNGMKPGEKIWGIFGQITPSPDGNWLATTESSYEGVFTYRFDRCSGAIEKYHYFAVPVDTCYPNVCDFGSGVCFSPDSRLLYFNTLLNVWQLDMQDTTLNSPFHLVQIDTAITYFPWYDNSFLGPNGKVYIGSASGLHTMPFIDKPDVRGFGCDLKSRGNGALAQPYTGLLVPPNMPHYGLGKLTGSPCDTIGKIEPPVITASYQIIIPNAFSPDGNGLNDTWHILNIPALQLAGITFQTVALYNRWGNEVFKSNDINFEWNGKGWASDTYYYFIRYRTKDGVSKVQKGSVTVVR